jgi:hypothetical protein
MGGAGTIAHRALEIAGLTIGLQYRGVEAGEPPEPYPLFTSRGREPDMEITMEVISSSSDGAGCGPADPGVVRATERHFARFLEVGRDPLEAAQLAGDFVQLMQVCWRSKQFQEVWTAALNDPTCRLALGVAGQCLLALDPYRRRAEVFLPRGGSVFYPLAYVIQTSIKVACALLLEQFEGFLLHASGVAVAGRGYLFAGASGVGKTTVAQKLSGHALVLADDAVAVRWDGSGFRAFPTPWNMELERLGTSQATKEGVPLAAILHLQQSQFDGILPLPSSLSGVKLIAQIMPGLNWFGSGQVQHLLELSVQLCEEVPGYDLRLTLGGDVWSTLQHRWGMAS